MILPKGLLRGRRVQLTALSEEDAPTIARWDGDSQFLRLYGARPARPRSEAGIAEWLKGLRDDDRTVALGIRPLDSDELLGTLELDGILWPHRVCGISVAIGDRQHWGQGYGYEAAELGLTFAFDEMNLHRVTGTVFSYNERSIAMVERLGFRREGTFREFLERDGKRHDMLLYGLLRPEWKARQQDE
ncbi:MAG: GNAT family protein [Anaerolineae bacterium]|jgi:RimJ/RimL family protein N-acetyltransferase